MPTIYPGLYRGKIKSVANSSITHTKQYKKSKQSRLPRILRYFDELIQDNIDYIDVAKQSNRDTAQHARVNVQYNNPSMSVIIHKKRTYTELL